MLRDRLFFLILPWEGSFDVKSGRTAGASTAERTSDGAVSDTAGGALGGSGVLLRPKPGGIMGDMMRLCASRAGPGVDTGLLTCTFSLVVKPLVCAKAEERL